MVVCPSMTYTSVLAQSTVRDLRAAELWYTALLDREPDAGPLDVAGDADAHAQVTTLIQPLLGALFVGELQAAQGHGDRQRIAIALERDLAVCLDHGQPDVRRPVGGGAGAC